MKYLAYLNLCDENSSHMIQMSKLMYQALLFNGGSRQLDVKELAKEIADNYPIEI